MSAFGRDLQLTLQAAQREATKAEIMRDPEMGAVARRHILTARDANGLCNHCGTWSLSAMDAILMCAT